MILKMTRLKALFEKHREGILYLIFGVLTTIVNFLAFWLFEITLGGDLYLVSNAIAWIIAVVFAYLTNKLLVFRSKDFCPRALLKEIPEFLGARVLSFLIEEGGMWLFVDALDFAAISFSPLGITVTGTVIAKAILAVIVVVLNYFFSKFIIFKEKKN